MPTAASSPWWRWTTSASRWRCRPMFRRPRTRAAAARPPSCARNCARNWSAARPRSAPRPRARELLGWHDRGRGARPRARIRPPFRLSPEVLAVDLKLPIKIHSELTDEVITSNGLLDLASGEIGRIEYEDY